MWYVAEVDQLAADAVAELLAVVGAVRHAELHDPAHGHDAAGDDHVSSGSAGVAAAPDTGAAAQIRGAGVDGAGTTGDVGVAVAGV